MCLVCIWDCSTLLPLAGVIKEYTVSKKTASFYFCNNSVKSFVGYQNNYWHTLYFDKFGT